ncbi:hypothetical protein ACLOJK_024547 [Asimina triloba]
MRTKTRGTRQTAFTAWQFPSRFLVMISDASIAIPFSFLDFRSTRLLCNFLSPLECGRIRAVVWYLAEVWPMSEMDACSSGSVNEGNALEGLLDAFVSAFSIEEITCAYHKAGGNADVAAEILSGWQDDKSSNASWMSDIRTSASKSECNLASSRELPCEKRFDNLACKGEHFGARSQEPLPSNSLDRHTHFTKRNRPKQKKNSYSIGTVSSFLGKGYAKSHPPSNGVCKVTKPLRVEVKEDDLREDVSVSNTVPRSELIRNKDVEEFLFSMLGEGFLLGKDVVREVLSQCGYDAKKVKLLVPT